MLKEFLIKNNIAFFENEDMKQHTTFKVGGKADFLALPADINQAQKLLHFIKENNINYYFLGRGSNVIFKDEGYHGVIIKTQNMNTIQIDGTTVKAGAGILLTNLCLTLQSHGLSGLEFCYGIPGNVGGATFMNAGAYGGEICQCIRSVEYLDQQGNLCTVSYKDAQFAYRHSIFQEHRWLITAVTFEMEHKDKDEMLKFMGDIMQKRKDKQPLDKPSAGSSFKRPQGYFAAALIDECGLKGFSVGGAQVSEKHAGFIINKGSATCKDIVTLAEKVEEIVYKQKGIQLEKEMIIVG